MPGPATPPDPHGPALARHAYTPCGRWRLDDELTLDSSLFDRTIARIDCDVTATCHLFRAATSAVRSTREGTEKAWGGSLFIAPGQVESRLHFSAM
jgi:hypothetical protein